MGQTKWITPALFMPGLLGVFSITVILAKEVVAKGPEEGNHKEHKCS